MSAEAYPLSWPIGKKRTPNRSRSRFDTTFARARGELVNELERLKATNIVLSTNIALKRDGMPYAATRQPDDPGVAIYFRRGKRELVFACDRWDRIEDNLWAIAKTIDAIRGIERWGSGDMVEAAFSGFQAICPPPGMVPSRPWTDVLQVGEEATRAYVEERYAKLAWQNHPDRGGDSQRMAEINTAYDDFRKERGL